MIARIKKIASVSWIVFRIILCILIASISFGLSLLSSLFGVMAILVNVVAQQLDPIEDET